MRITELTIEKFKNLRDFRIDFDPASFTTVIVGQNGTGKSNVLEALTIIFRDLDLGENPNFAYHLKYFCRGAEVVVDANPLARESTTIKVDGKKIGLNDFSRKGGSQGQYLPRFVFGYYSGPNNRMERHFEKHQQQFAADLLAGIHRPLRPLFYARLVHSQFALLSFFCQDGAQENFLGEHLRLQSLDSVLFAMKRPYWPSHPRGDTRFWGAYGVVQEFLSRLYDLSLSPLRLKRKGSKGVKGDRLYLYLKSQEDLMILAKSYVNEESVSQQRFFTALESMYVSDLVLDVHPRINVRGVDGTLDSRELSEGEQQLLMVLGLLRFTRDDEALFLLDEPDTHLNPAWSQKYLNLLKDVMAGHQETSQVIMATHDPLVIAGLSREEVQLMRRDEHGRVSANHPEEDPKGMGVEGLLTSDIYGLRSALDLQTLNDVDRQRELATKSEELSPEEKKELAGLNQKLSALDFTVTVRDPLYKPFVDAMSKVERENEWQVPVLSPEQMKERMRVAMDIVRQLKSEQAQSEEEKETSHL